MQYFFNCCFCKEDLLRPPAEIRAFLLEAKKSKFISAGDSKNLSSQFIEQFSSIIFQ